MLFLAIGQAATGLALLFHHEWLFPPLGGSNGRAVFHITATEPTIPSFNGSLTLDDLQILRRRTDTFDSVSAYGRESMTIDLEGVPVTLTGEVVSAEYFDMFDVVPLEGRPIAKADEHPSAAPVLVLSQQALATHFRGRAMLGSKVRAQTAGDYTGFVGTPVEFTVVGIAPAGFLGARGTWRAADYWVPVGKDAGSAGRENQAWRGYALARFVGPTEPAVRAALESVAGEVRRANYPSHELWNLGASRWLRLRLPFESSGLFSREGLSVILMVMGLAALFIATSSAFAIELTKHLERQHSVTVRLILGENPLRQLAHATFETALLAGSSALLAAVAAPWVAERLAGTLVQLVPGGSAHDVPTRSGGMSGAVFFVSVLVSATFVAALTALKAYQLFRHEPSAAGPVRRTLGPPSRWSLGAQKWFVSCQIVTAIASATVISQLFGTLWAALSFDDGLDTAEVLALRVATPGPARQELLAHTVDQRIALNERLANSLQSVPGVRAVGSADRAPFELRGGWILKEGDAAGQHSWVSVYRVSPLLLEVFGVSLLRGQTLASVQSSDRSVAVVSDSAARHVWAGEDPIGSRIALQGPGERGPSRWLTIVGIVSDVRPPVGLRRPIQAVYVLPPPYFSDVYVRFDDLGGDKSQFLAALSRAGVVAWAIEPVERTVARARYPLMAVSSMVAAVGLCALVLGAGGLYSSVSYLVQVRRKEIATRLAVGGPEARVLMLVMFDGWRHYLLAAVLGSVLGFVVCRGLLSVLGTEPEWSWSSWVWIQLSCASVLLAAAYLPASWIVGQPLLPALRSASE